MKRTTHSITILSAALLTGALVACGGASTPAAPSSASVSRIEVTPGSASVAVGASVTLNAVAKDAQGQVISNVPFAWKSSSDAVASVANGVVQGLVVGSASITALAGGVTSAPVAVNVTLPAQFDLSLSADKLPVVTGTSASLTVNVARKSGFTGAVSLSLTGLPAGASAASVTLPEGQSSATVTVSAASGAAHSQPTPVTLTGGAGGASLTRSLTVTVRGPAGSLDTTFGAGGISKNPIGQAEDYGYAAALQPDGKIVMVGSVKGPTFEDFGIIRLTRDGTLDPTFGTGGKVVIDFATDRDLARAVAIQNDGKIVVAGGTAVAGDHERFGLLRLNPNGTLDTGFGTGGKLVTAFEGSDGDRAGALLIQPDGRILVGGQASFSSSTSGVDFALARYLPSGAPDTSFGTGGQVTTPVSSNAGSDKIFALALQGDKIVAAGGDVFQLTRYTAAGVLDASFGTGGKVQGVFPSSSGATSLQVDAQNRLVVGGQEQMNTAVVRLTPQGALDASFGSGGKTVLKLNPSNWNVTTGVAIQTDGKIVTGNWVYEGNTSNDHFAVTRLNDNGQPDASFGSGGTVVTKGAANTRSTARAVLLQPDDRIPATRIILAGDSNYDFTLTRYWP